VCVQVVKAADGMGALVAPLAAATAAKQQITAQVEVAPASTPQGPVTAGEEEVAWVEDVHERNEVDLHTETCNGVTEAVMGPPIFATASHSIGKIAQCQRTRRVLYTHTRWRENASRRLMLQSTVGCGSDGHGGHPGGLLPEPSGPERIGGAPPDDVERPYHQRAQAGPLRRCGCNMPPRGRPGNRPVHHGCSLASPAGPSGARASRVSGGIITSLPVSLVVS
jgi:hypothetical protein